MCIIFTYLPDWTTNCDSRALTKTVVAHFGMVKLDALSRTILFQPSYFQTLYSQTSSAISHCASRHTLALFLALASAVSFSASGASSLGMKISTNWIYGADENVLSLKRSWTSCFVLTW